MSGLGTGWVWLLAWLALGWSIPAFAEPRAEKSPDLVVISIDGLRPEFYWDETWPAPCLQRLRQQGAAAREVLPVFPSITYANHATLVTGVSPQVHGIDCNIDFDWQTGPRPGWNWESHKLQSPPLWELAERRGLDCAAFSWPVTVGARMLVNVPEVFHVPGANQGTTESLIRQWSTPGLLDEIQASHRSPFPQTFAEWDAWLPRAVHHVWQKHRPQLTLIHMLNLDWTQHRFGLHGPEVTKALADLDVSLERLIAPLDLKKTLLFVVGDHGFSAVHRQVALNRLWLEQGWIQVDQSRIQSWQVLARTNGGSAAIYCKDPSLEPKVRHLLQQHAGGNFVILERPQLDALKTFSGAFLAVSALPGTAFTSALEAEFVTPTPRVLGQHGHLPQLVPTGWIQVGPGIPGGVDLGYRSILEVAPTVGHHLGLEIDHMEAKPVLPELP